MASVNNSIPFVPENTIDPAAGLNEAINVIDALLQLRVLSVGGNTPPGSPEDGARYIVGTSPTGAWSGKEAKLARWLDGYWSFYDAVIAINAADGNIYVRAGSSWSAASSGGGAGTVTSVDLSAPTGFAVSGGPVTGAGTLALSFASGYSLPTNTLQSQWSDAYGWGNHSSAGYGVLANANTWTALQTFGEGVTISAGKTIGVQNTGNASDDVYFVSVQANTGSNIRARPNGSGPSAGFIAMSSSDVSNASRMQFFINSTGCNFASNQTGSASNVQMNFTAMGAPRLTIDADVRPYSDNSINLGAASFRWKEVFAGNNVINTSDAREKTSVRPLTGDELAAAADLAREIGAFKFLHAIDEKGDQARSHIGMTVQRAIEILNDHDLDPMEYGFICYDQWDEYDIHDVDEQGTLLETVPAGDRYSFRFEQLMAFIIAGQEQRLRSIESALAT